MRLDVDVEADEMLDEGGDIICHAGSDGVGLWLELGAVASVGESRIRADWSCRNWCCACACCCIWSGGGIWERESDLVRVCACCPG